MLGLKAKKGGVSRFITSRYPPLRSNYWVSVG